MKRQRKIVRVERMGGGDSALHLICGHVRLWRPSKQKRHIPTRITCHVCSEVLTRAKAEMIKR